MTDRDRALAPNKYETHEATYITLDRLRRLMIGRRSFGGRSSEIAVAASGGVDDPARRVGAGSRNELGAGASRTGWRSASSLRYTNLGNVEARPERKALETVRSLLVETVEDGALGLQDAMSGAPLKSLGKRSNSRYPAGTCRVTTLQRMPVFNYVAGVMRTWS
jgi:hypothetical protein